jgi:hypothetical protein
LTLGTTVERVVCDIESVSDDLKTRIDALGYQDKWAALKLVGAAATAATGVGGGCRTKILITISFTQPQ